MASGLLIFCSISLLYSFCSLAQAEAPASPVKAGTVQLRLLNRTTQAFDKTIAALRREIETVSHANLTMPQPRSYEPKKVPFCLAVCGEGDSLVFDLDNSDEGCVAAWPYVHLADDREAVEGQSDYHLASLPCFVAVENSSIPGADLGVFTRLNLPKGVVLGPYEGQVIRTDDVEDNTYVWDLNDEVDEDGGAFSIDGKDFKLGNWIRYVNSARWGEEQNCVGILRGFEVHYAIYQPVSAGSELLVWYGPRYELPYKVNGNLYDEGISPPKKEVRCPSCKGWDGKQEAPKRSRQQVRKATKAPQTRQQKRHNELK